MLTVDRIDLFYGAAQALRSVSVKAQTGRILTVLGRNGVGKSSLLRAIVGQHMPASGAIHWNDQDMTKMTPHLRAKAGFGYVPQGREIFPLLPARETLVLGCATRPRTDPPPPAARGRGPSGWFWTNRPRASSHRSSRTSGAPSSTCAERAKWR